MSKKFAIMPLPSRRDAWPILLAAVAALTQGASHAQAINAWGSTIRNPGSIVPEWWNETSYNPERLNGAFHLRIGSAGNFSGSPQAGVANCEMAMLYAAKSGQALTAEETVPCALAEWNIFKGTSGDRRNMGDQFVIKDTIAEFSKVVAARVDQLRQNDLFYMRAVGVQIDPVDINAGGMVFRLNLTTGNIPVNFISPVKPQQQVSYRWEEPHMRKGDVSVWGVRLADNEAGLREMERARTTYKFNQAMNFFVFRIAGTREVREGSGLVRYLKMDLKEFGIPYQTQEGRTITTGIKQ